MLSSLDGLGHAEVFRPERLMESCEDDRELAHDVVEDFLRAAPQVLARLEAALAAGDAVQARLEAHSLKGSCQTLGAESLAAVGARLEDIAKRGELAEAPALFPRAAREFAALRAVLEEYLQAA